MEMNDIVIHDNTWNFGRVLVIVIASGKALCKVTWYEGDDEAFISNLIVHPSVQRQGLGNQLLELTEETVKEILNVKRIALCAYKDSFTVDWYKRKGFEITHYDEDDDPILKKDILK